MLFNCLVFREPGKPGVCEGESHAKCGDAGIGCRVCGLHARCPEKAPPLLRCAEEECRCLACHVESQVCVRDGGANYIKLKQVLCS